MAAPFSLRARPGATVSMPLTWARVERSVKIADFTIENALARVKRSGDPWGEFFEARHKLPAAPARKERES